MMPKLGRGLFRVLAAMLLPALAAAQTAITTKDVHLRAGPARSYPVVAVLPAGIEVSVQGCLSGYRWCDVVAGAERGWVWAGNLDSSYQGAYVPLVPYAPRIGITVIPFIFFDYWSDHYRHRPWYADRDRWARPPPRPAPGVRLPPPPRPAPGLRPAPEPRPSPGMHPPPGSQPHPPSTRPTPPPQTDRRLPPPPPPGVSRQGQPPGAGAQGEQRR